MKSHSLDGYDSPYVPGLGLPWPAHRTRRSRRSTAASAPSSTPRNSAPPAASSRSEQVDLQRADFKRFGVLGDWDRPYMTMDPRFEAQQIRALGQDHPQRTLL